MVIKTVVYTDGASTPKQKPGRATSAAVCIFEQESGRTRIMEIGKFIGDTTNGVSELMGVELAVLGHKSVAPGSPLEVITDSQYVRGIFTRKGDEWEYRAKKNVELVWRIRKKLPEHFTINWVKGHDENRYNERADAICQLVKDTGKSWFALYDENTEPPELKGFDQ